MELQITLMPPVIEPGLLTSLAELADRIADGPYEECDPLVEQFNRESGLTLRYDDFQGIYGAEDHESWVQRCLWSERIRPTPNVTREELVEVIRRATPRNEMPDCDGYAIVFDVNVAKSGASSLIYEPPEHFRGDVSEYDPTPEQIVDWVLEDKNRVIRL